MQIKQKINIAKLPGSLIEIEGQIDWADLEHNRSQAIKNIGQNMELPGFRKGYVPENILLKNIPESAVLEEMAELAMPKAYLKIMEDNKIDAIGRPEISITKLAPGNPLGFKIKTAVLPQFKLPDYKSIAAAENKNKGGKAEVAEEEIEKTIAQIRKMRSGHKDHDHEVEEKDLPPLNDEFVKSLGNFADVEDFKTKLKENIRLEKENKEKEKQRIKIIEALLNKTDIELPRILIESELDKMIHQLRSDIETSGLKFEDYLVHLKKTEEDMRKEWDKEAEKRAKFELILNSIGEAEKIKIEDNILEAEVKKVLEMYKDADPVRARDYVGHVLKNEKIFLLLENQ